MTDAEHTISVKHGLNQEERLFSKFPNGALLIQPVANLRSSRKPLPTDGTLPFRARNVFGQKSSCPPPDIASPHYLIWENLSAIGDSE